MGKLFKLIKLWGSFRSVEKEYLKAKSQGRPWYMSREFRGAAIAFLGLVSSVLLNVEIEQETLGAITDSLDKIVPPVMLVYGAIMEVVVAVKYKKQKK